VPLAVETDSKTSDGHVNGMASAAPWENAEWRRENGPTFTQTQAQGNQSEAAHLPHHLLALLLLTISTSTSCNGRELKRVLISGTH